MLDNMKKSIRTVPILLLLCVSAVKIQAANPIWINPMSGGQPIATYYRGDTIGEWFFNFEIGQASWDYAQIGIGTDTGSLNWAVANYYEDGAGSDKRVRRNLSGYQFTATGSHYVICQAKEGAGDTYTSASVNGWTASTTYPPGSLGYFTCSAINAPSGQSATKDAAHGDYEIDLAYTDNAQSNWVLILCKEGSAPGTDPTQGSPYSAGNTIDGATVLYVGDGSGGTFTHNRSDANLKVKPGTQYYYKFYSENNSYYSSAVSANATTDALGAPTGFSATKDGTHADYQINLAYTRDGTHNIMIVGREGSDLSADPTQLISYSAGDSLGDGKVLYKGAANSWTHDKNDGNLAVRPAYAYYYRVYSECYNYYSTAVSDNETTSNPDPPSACGTVIANPTQINLSWTKSAGGYNVIVVCRRGTDLTGDPSDNTAYVAGDSIGGGKVVYNGADTSYSHTALISNGCTYYYRFYSEAWSKYTSAGSRVEKSTATDTTGISNLLPSPGFETGSGTDAYYWEQWGNSGRENWAWAGVTGSYMYAFYGYLGGGGNAGAYQNIYAAPKFLYKFTYSATKEATFAATSVEIKLEYYNESDANIKEVSSSILGSIQNRDTWTEFSVYALTPDNALYVRPVLSAGNMTAGGAVGIDQTSLIRFDLTPLWNSPAGSASAEAGYTLNPRFITSFKFIHTEAGSITDSQLCYSKSSDFSTNVTTFTYTDSALGWNPAGPWTNLQISTYTPQGDLDATTYYMRIRAYSEAWGAWSNTRKVVIRAANWTDTLTTDATEIRAVHTTELRDTINNLRVFRGFTPTSWTDPTITADVTEVRKVHMDEMRSSLGAALTFVDEAYSWTDSTITEDVTEIKAAHYTELRTKCAKP